MPVRHIRISQIYWFAPAETRPRIAEVLLSQTAGGKTAWVRSVNETFTQEGLIQWPISGQILLDLREKVFARAEDDNPTESDLLACLLPEEDAKSRPDRSSGLRENERESLDKRREEGRPVDIFFDLSMSVPNRMKAGNVSHEAARNLHFEAMKEAKQQIVSAKIEGVDLLDAESDYADMELDGLSRSDRYMKLLRNKSVPSSFIADVITAIGQEGALRFLNVAPEDRLPLLILAGETNMFSHRGYLPKKLLEENYEGVVQEFGRWLSTGVTPDVPDRLKTWARITD